MTRLALTLAALALCATPALATQAKASAPAPTPADAWSTPMLGTWPRGYSRQDKIWVITNAKPGVRQSCRHPEVTDTTVTCKRRLRKAAVFSRNDVAALLTPMMSDNRDLFTCAAIVLGVGGATIYGGVLLTAVAIGGAIPVIALGSFIAFTAGACAIGASGDQPETILYQQSNTPLSITLKN